MTSSTDITFVLTSCGRFDLLAETMASFLACNTAPIARYVVIEDSGDAAVRDVLAASDVAIDVIVNDPPLGQMPSIDRAYAGVQTPYIFHCEDDWRFFRSGFIEDSLALLEQFPDISTVGCRRAGQNPNHDRITRAGELGCWQGVEFRRQAAGADRVWGGYSLNPGLRRLADYHRMGTFAAMVHEGIASQWFKGQRMCVAVLENPACETTGSERHVFHNRLVRSRRPGTVAAPSSRNAPCPCGSGERYKYCHGAAS